MLPTQRYFVGVTCPTTTFIYQPKEFTTTATTHQSMKMYIRVIFSEDCVIGGDVSQFTMQDNQLVI